MEASTLIHMGVGVPETMLLVGWGLKRSPWRLAWGGVQENPFLSCLSRGVRPPLVPIYIFIFV